MTSTGPETSETPGATTQRHGFGIDVGGSGIKAESSTWTPAS